MCTEGTNVREMLRRQRHVTEIAYIYISKRLRFVFVGERAKRERGNERDREAWTNGVTRQVLSILPVSAVINPRQNWFTIVYAYTFVCVCAFASQRSENILSRPVLSRDGGEFCGVIYRRVPGACALGVLSCADSVTLRNATSPRCFFDIAEPQA